jgi:hypothetical protein
LLTFRAQSLMFSFVFSSHTVLASTITIPSILHDEVDHAVTTRSSFLCFFSVHSCVWTSISRVATFDGKIGGAARHGGSLHLCAWNQEGCRRLMNGNAYAKAGVDEPGKAKPISESEAMGEALAAATSIVLIGTNNPVEASTLETFLKYTYSDKLQKLVLLSKMVASTSGGGFFGGSNKAEQASEHALAAIARQKNLDFSIIRTGILKGGGPGSDEDGKIIQKFGLDRTYYNKFLDVVEFKVALAHDKFSLGADATSVVKRDPNKMPNMMTQMGTKSSFDPSPTDTNRIVAASVAVTALHEDIGPIEISIGSAAGRQLPTPEEWKALLQSLQ